MAENWIELTLGAIILIAPWAFGFAGIPLARWTDMLCGLALVLVNIWEIYGKNPAADGPEQPPSKIKQSKAFQ